MSRTKALSAPVKGALPSLDELRDPNSLHDLSRSNDLNVLLNEPPPESWIKEHPYIKGHKYIPAPTLEWLMTRIFVEWRTEVISVQSLANAVAVTVRVHFRNPTTGDMDWRDGVGASGLQTDKGAKAADLMSIKTGAVEMGLPKAKTEAFKDAVGDLGRLFGRDINRKVSMEYRGLLGQIDNELSVAELEELQTLVATSNVNESMFCQFFGVTAIAEIPKDKFKAAKMRLIDILKQKQ